MLQFIYNISQVTRIIFLAFRFSLFSVLRRYNLIPSYLLILTIFCRKNDNQLGKNIALLLEKLGPVFIKFGQSMSARPDILGGEVAHSLSRLQDRLAEFPYEDVREIIRAQFGCEIEEIFIEFEKKPVAAASIAQVHKAVTKSNKVVAVKILRPGVEKKFKKDIAVIEFVLGMLIKKMSKVNQQAIGQMIQNFRRGIEIELNLSMEAAAASKLKQISNAKYVVIPNIEWSLVGQRVLTMDWVDGYPINDVENLQNLGMNPEQIAKKLAIVFFDQAYGHGYFHADLHPGNILISKDGKIILLDFGIMGILDKKKRVYLAEILYAFLKRNYERVAEIYFQAGFIPKGESVTLFSQALRAIGEPIFELPANKISIAELLHKLLNIISDFNIEIQPDLFLLQKNMLLVEGIGYKLYPEKNIWQLAEPWIEKWAIHNIGVEAKIRDRFLEIIDHLVAKLTQ